MYVADLPIVSVKRNFNVCRNAKITFSNKD